MDSDAVISLRGLEKTYRDFWGRKTHPALRGMDLTVRRGESHALLGPNGSGKTTTLRILLGLVRPTAGSVSILGGVPTDARVRQRVGFLPEGSALHGFLRAHETVELFARLHGVSRRDARARSAELLEAVDLAAHARKRVHQLSHGMRRRLALAVALAGRPELLVLDEPTAGMDPLVRERILTLIRGHVDGGGTLLVTSHLLGDIRGIARRATLLSEGRVVREGAMDDLLGRPGLRSYLASGSEELDTLVAAAVAGAGGRLVESGPARATIEDLFVETYGKEADDAPDPGGR